MGIFKIISSGEFYKLRKYRIHKIFFKDYKRNPLHPFRTFSIHRKGFTLADWGILGVTNSNWKSFLSSKQYLDIHPINGFYSKMIDDKMVIKYILNGTDLAKNMPDYYYLFDEDGSLFPMMEAPSQGNAAGADVLGLLKSKQKLAFKLITGSLGIGFYKAAYENGEILVNDKKMTESEFMAFLRTCRDCIVTEYLAPHPELAKFWPSTANTLRYLVGKVNGEWRMIKCFVRFGTKKSGAVENFNSGGVLCYVDEDGYFKNGYMISRQNGKASAVVVDTHPDTGLKIEGRIPCWDQLLETVAGFERLMPQMKYMGFDFVVTDREQVKLLEINSLTSLDSIQLDRSILETENGKWFFSSLMK
jgi:hypothetical protein